MAHLEKNRKDFADAQLFYADATLDYIAARCCMLNGIHLRGHALVCEAIEKSLKSIYIVEFGKGHMENRHNLLKIKKDIKNREFLSPYDSLLEYLSDAHKARYTLDKNGKANNFPSQYTPTYRSTDFLFEIDNLWLVLFDKIPLSDEAKYKSLFISALHVDILENYKFWLIHENKPIIPRLDELVKFGRKYI